jgi:hypothetical protein
MADQAALVIAGLLFGGCDLSEPAASDASPGTGPQSCRADRDRTAKAAGGVPA